MNKVYSCKYNPDYSLMMGVNDFYYLTLEDILPRSLCHFCVLTCQSKEGVKQFLSIAWTEVFDMLFSNKIWSSFT